MKIFFLVLSFFLHRDLFAGIHVDWIEKENRSQLQLRFDEPLKETPDWTIHNQKLVLHFSGMSIKQSYHQKVSGAKVYFENHIEGQKPSLKVTVAPTYSKIVKAEDVSLSVQSHGISVQLSPGVQAPKSGPSAPKIVDNSQANTKDQLDEAYLANLEKELQAQNATKSHAVVENQDKKPESTQKTTLTDKLKTTQSSLTKVTDNNAPFSLTKYVSKFLVFLGLVLLVFWGIVQLMKRGVLNRSKLGFLNGTSLVQVLSTTFVAPKRSLLLIKAHQQVFLISSTEQGMTLISEIKDVPGVVKAGERNLVGENFDDSLKVSETVDLSQIKEKVNIYESQVQLNAKENLAPRFSEMLKQKARNLKPLQS